MTALTALLDTHAFLWWVTDDPQLSPTARAAIADPANTILFSVASAWEIAIKAGTGRYTLPERPEIYIPSRVASNGFTVLPIGMAHTLRTYALPPHHRDPFDRILIAQSMVEGVPIISVDSMVAAYGVPILW